MGRPAGSFTVALGDELKERLLTAARAGETTASVLARRAIFESLREEASVDDTPAVARANHEAFREFRVRVPDSVAARLAEAARAAGMTRSAYLSAAVAQISDRSEMRRSKGQALDIEAAGSLREALVRSNATLAPIGRNLNQIARAVNAHPQLMSTENRQCLAEIARQVARHLELASDLLHAVRTQSMSTGVEGIAALPGRKP